MSFFFVALALAHYLLPPATNPKPPCYGLRLDRSGQDQHRPALVRLDAAALPGQMKGTEKHGGSAATELAGHDLATSGAVLLLDPHKPLPPQAPARIALFINQPLPINRADQDSLALLPGIGPKLAGAIIETRRHNGPLQDLEDLYAVPGLGPKKSQALLPWLSFE